MTTKTAETQHQLLLRALILTGLIGFGLFVAATTGLLNLVFESDRSYISSVIFGCYAALSAQWFYLVLEMSRASTVLDLTRRHLAAADAGDLHLESGSVRIAGFAVPPGYLADFLEDILRVHQRSGRRDQQVLLEALGERLVSRHAFGGFAADALLKLGLLGTIIGFIMMLAPVAELQDFDSSVLQRMLGDMSGGMAVALFTTIAGLVTSTLLSLQYELLHNASVHFLSATARTVEIDVLPLLAEAQA